MKGANRAQPQVAVERFVAGNHPIASIASVALQARQLWRGPVIVDDLGRHHHTRGGSCPQPAQAEERAGVPT
jgi:hypothetical protein